MAPQGLSGPQHSPLVSSTERCRRRCPAFCQAQGREGCTQTHTVGHWSGRGSYSKQRLGRTEDRGWSPVPKACTQAKVAPYQPPVSAPAGPLALNRAQGNQLWFQETSMVGTTGHLLWL